jgi:hypothetical protein
MVLVVSVGGGGIVGVCVGAMVSIGLVGGCCW